MNATVTIEDEKSSSLYFFVESKVLRFKQSTFENQIEKPDGGRPMVKVLWTDLPQPQNGTNELKFLRNDKENKKTLVLDLSNETFGDTEPENVGKPGDYWLYLNDKLIDDKSLWMDQGANYNILLSQNEYRFHQVWLMIKKEA